MSYTTPLKQILTPSIPMQETLKEKSVPAKSEKKKAAPSGKSEAKEKVERNEEDEGEEQEPKELERESSGKKSSGTAPNNNVNYNGDFFVNIAQTLIKEGTDHKPFIEYLIYCKKGQQKWLVSRKYKNFCDLHQLLMGMFPGIQFPSSSKILINSFNDFTSLQDLRKPKIIDERKIILEAYLQEICQYSEVLNCLPFKQFVGIEGKNGKQFSNDFLDIDNFDESNNFFKIRVIFLKF